MISRQSRSEDLKEQYLPPARKRRRSSPRQSARMMSVEIPPEINAHRNGTVGMLLDDDGWPPEKKDKSMTIASTAKLAGQAVAPFLAKHIPDQYAPLGGPSQVKADESKNPNSKYCYRHRPDLKCRRQADEPSMDQLQRVRIGYSRFCFGEC